MSFPQAPQSEEWETVITISLWFFLGGVGLFLEVCSSTFYFRKFQMCRTVLRATQWTWCWLLSLFVVSLKLSSYTVVTPASTMLCHRPPMHVWDMVLSWSYFKSPSTDTKHVGTYGPFSKSLQMPPKVFCCYSFAGFISLCSAGTVLEVFVVILINQNLRVCVSKKVTQFEFIWDDSWRVFSQPLFKVQAIILCGLFPCQVLCRFTCFCWVSIFTFCFR